MDKTKELLKIKEEIIRLESLPLYEERVRNNFFPVIGEGNHFARIFFVGEAPGRNEAKTGKPFCGEAGKVLDSLFSSSGIKREDVILIGHLSQFYVWVSNFIVQPILGYINYQPDFVPDIVEVESVITASLSDFMDEQLVKRKEIHTSQGFVIDAPYYNIEGEVVWGATAMMLSEFREVLLGIK